MVVVKVKVARKDNKTKEGFRCGARCRYFEKGEGGYICTFSPDGSCVKATPGAECEVKVAETLTCKNCGCYERGCTGKGLCAGFSDKDVTFISRKLVDWMVNLPPEVFDEQLATAGRIANKVYGRYMNRDLKTERKDF